MAAIPRICRADSAAVRHPGLDYRRLPPGETDAVPMLLEQARLPQPLAEQAHKLAHQLAEKLRNQNRQRSRRHGAEPATRFRSLFTGRGGADVSGGGAAAYSGQSHPRCPHPRDKISNGNWQSHRPQPSLFVNAATQGLLFTGKLVSTHNKTSLSLAEPDYRQKRRTADSQRRRHGDAFDGEQFVTGETIAEALANARKLEERFRYSYDMLGEAALTAADAQAYMVSYQQAIHAIGKASNGRGIYEGRGISISSLRCTRATAAHNTIG